MLDTIRGPRLRVIAVQRFASRSLRLGRRLDWRLIADVALSALMTAPGSTPGPLQQQKA